MRYHQLSIKAHHRSEVLERLLRVIRHRGFRVQAMNVSSEQTAKQINVELTVASQRPIALLLTQLSKLLDVVHVEVSQQTSEKISA